MRQFQSMSRGAEARDFNLIEGNSSYVQTWSMVQCLIVILCTVVQVFQQETISARKNEKISYLTILNQYEYEWRKNVRLYINVN